MSDYKKSLNLPDTSFPMKANLTQREPEMLRWWEENNIYGTMLEASGSRGSFRLHDGPPYANGHLHLGPGSDCRHVCWGPTGPPDVRNPGTAWTPQRPP